MSDIVKKKIIEVETGQAQKNVENLSKSFVPLRTQIRNLINEMSTLEEGTDAYNQAARQLADLQQKQIEITETAKYSNQDFGAVLSNVTKVSLGFVGGINAISASLALLGGDAQKMQEVIAPIQLLMAVIQGVSAVDEAIKSLQGLNNVLKGLGKTADEVKDINIDVDTNKADSNVKTLNKELGSLSDKKVEIKADTKGLDTSVEKVSENLEKISDKKIDLEVNTDGLEDSLSTVSEKIDSIKDIELDVKSDSIDDAAKDIKNLTNNQKTLTTSTKQATVATTNLNTATAATSSNVKNVTSSTKQAAVATTTLATTEGVATKATWTLTGALKAVGTAIKSIPVIGWIAMGITLLTSLIRLIVNANKESKEGEKISREIMRADEERLEALKEIENKHRKIRTELYKNLELLKELPKESRLYADTLEKIASSLGLSVEYIQTHEQAAKNATEYLTEINTLQENITENENKQAEAIKTREKLEQSVLKSISAGYDASKEILQNVVDGGIEGVRITEKQMDKIEEIRKKRVRGTYTAKQAEEEALKVIRSQVTDLNNIVDITKESIEENNRTLEIERKKLDAIQTESDAYDKMLEKQKESKEAAKDYIQKYLEAQKSYFELIENMEIADAEYNSYWDKYAEYRKKKAERIYNEELQKYYKQFDDKLITQEQYNNILKHSEEEFNKELENITLETNKKVWDKKLKNALEEIEKEKLARKKANEEEYVVNVKTNVSDADFTKNINDEKAELDAILKTNNVLKERLNVLQQNKIDSKEYADEVKSLQDEIAQNEQKAQDIQTKIDLDSYNQRKKQAEDYYNAIDQFSIDSINQSIIYNNGNESKIFSERINIELQAIQHKMDAVKQAYEEGLIAEAEYNSRSLELQAEYVQKSNEFSEQHRQNIINTTSTYTQTLQTLGSSVSNILQSVMGSYDQNSEEYKKMAVANATIQTISGQLSAFFSGVNSGVPAPWNFVLGGVLAGEALATGLIGIKNIKSGTISQIGGNVSTAATNIGRGEYESTVYAQQNEMFGTIRDQRVVVLEHDITEAQRNVEVLEFDNSF